MSAVHLHLLLNHLPVVGTVLGILLLAVAWARGSAELTRVTLGLFVFLAVAALAVYLTGEPAEEMVEGLAGVSGATVERHEEAALAATLALGAYGLLALASLLRFRRRAIPRSVAALALALALVPAGAMGFAANLGGQIRHSEIRADAVAASAPTDAAAEHAQDED